jgi:redox-sensitive bicupin YhaK (pirin superfamily)
VAEEHNGLVYVFNGELMVGVPGTRVAEGAAALLSDGDSLILEVDRLAEKPAELLFIAGTPLNEPIARGGPFVMNTKEEIEQAFEDYKAGRMGRID